MKATHVRDKKLLARVYFCNTLPRGSYTDSEIVRAVTSDISDLAVGYAGFSKKKYLRELLLQHMFDVNPFAVNTSERSSSEQTAFKEIKDGLLKANDLLPIVEPLYIFIFPSYSDFVKKRMEGVSGYTPWKNTILIFLDEDAQHGALEKTIVHEYVHAVSLKFHTWTTLGDSLVFEGLAENFVSTIYKRSKSPWTKALSRDASLKYFRSLHNKITTADPKLEYELFFGDTRYPLWSGYAIGYWVVNAYRQQHPKVSWTELCKTKPAHILRK